MENQTLVKRICPTTIQEWVKKGFSIKGNTTAETSGDDCCSSSSCC